MFGEDDVWFFWYVFQVDYCWVNVEQVFDVGLDVQVLQFVGVIVLVVVEYKGGKDYQWNGGD